MTYQELKTALKSFQEQGHIIPALNSKKEILEAALLQLQALTSAEVAIEPITESTTSTIETPETVATTEVTIPPQENTVTTTAKTITTTENPEPAPSVAPSDLATMPTARLISIYPEHPAVTGLREVAKVAEWLLIWTVTLLRSFVRFTTPYVARGCQNALRTAVYTAVAIRIFILPKLAVIAYSLGIWALTLVLKTFRKLSIA